MKITTHNYEIYFIDYFDGNLPKSKEQELYTFLEKNPLLKEEFESFEEIRLTPENDEFFTEKIKLKRIPEEADFCITDSEKLCISYIENDISANDKIIFKHKLINDPQTEKDFKIIKKTILIPNTNIVFKYKNRIKRHVVPIGILRTITASAAAILVAVVIFTQLYNNPVNKNAYSLNKIKTNFSTSKTAIIFNHQTNNSLNTIHSNNTSNITVNNQNNLVDNYEKEKDSLQNGTINTLPEINTKVLKQRFLLSDKLAKEKIKIDTTKAAQNKTEKQGIDVWKIAESGVKTWNAITSSDVQMNNTYSKTGNIEKLSINYRKLKFSKSFNKNRY